MDLLTVHDLLLALLVGLGAALYSSVGHAGASAYIALMALFGVPATTMRPTALTLNIIVATLASGRYLRAGLFRWRVLWPFLITAVPMAFLGGGIVLPSEIYRPLVGAVLWISALRLFWPTRLRAETEPRDPPIVMAMLAGAFIGLLSGLTGTGGGIFLSPILLFMRWSPVKRASGVAAIFILANSIAGLAGNMSAVQNLPPQLPLFAAAALVGGVVGTTLGIRLNAAVLTKCLGVVLVIAGAKMIGVY
ncbi:sulfite exporter TauE/SafE family protein [Sphingobium sp. DEHP117]|uniref:sulfite exporter TauE/SafE family protein n=1 Tax=Sphingobium sp. DEHP117 TaxID=2993436 RepID=UPI0027D55B90|nr:TSUP family transporter [Sphingobium sp. DEHP117]MDQ4420767.1 sulfite exporter TauE/SafE family protein [Sphingobium sp. DEHP117]